MVLRGVVVLGAGLMLVALVWLTAGRGTDAQVPAEAIDSVTVSVEEPPVTAAGRSACIAPSAAMLWRKLDERSLHTHADPPPFG